MTGQAAAEELATFIEAYGRIERHGVHGAMLLMGIEEWDPWFVEGIEMFGGELGRLEAEEAREEAERAKAVRR